MLSFLLTLALGVGATVVRRLPSTMASAPGCGVMFHSVEESQSLSAEASKESESWRRSLLKHERLLLHCVDLTLKECLDQVSSDVEQCNQTDVWAAG